MHCPASPSFVSNTCYPDCQLVTDMISFQTLSGENIHHLSVSAFYDCPCSIEERNPEKVEHNLKCSKHAGFRSVESTQSRNYETSKVKEQSELDHDQAYSHHLPRLSYLDVSNDFQDLSEEVDRSVARFRTTFTRSRLLQFLK